jgi:hypothetical protein
MGVSLNTMPDSSKDQLTDLLRKHRNAVLKEWHLGIMLKQQETKFAPVQGIDRFADPAAHAFKEAIDAVYKTLVDGCDLDMAVLEYAVKIKAVRTQDPSEGASFVYALKAVIRHLFPGAAAKEALHEFDAQIDRIAETAEEMFHKDRKKIRELAGIQSAV